MTPIQKGARTEFFNNHGTHHRITKDRLDEGTYKDMQGTSDTDEEEMIVDNRNACLRVICPITDSPYMISQESKFKTRWDILIIMLTLFAVFLTPV